MQMLELHHMSNAVLKFKNTLAEHKTCWSYAGSTPLQRLNNNTSAYMLNVFYFGAYGAQKFSLVTTTIAYSKRILHGPVQMLAFNLKTFISCLNDMPSLGNNSV